MKKTTKDIIVAVGSTASTVMAKAALEKAIDYTSTHRIDVTLAEKYPRRKYPKRWSHVIKVMSRIIILLIFYAP